jgi:luciferase family oxidoreductase group 1
MIPLSVLDLSPVPQGARPATALRNSLDLARHAERLGYNRYWLAEHHNMPGIASAATAVVIGHVAAGTSRIRVGSGGIMLPNHSPLVIAEQFGTLAELYPGRIDLGLGRAPGADQLTARAMRRDPMQAAENFPRDVQELRYLLEPAAANQAVRAVPGEGTRVPLWLLGSSDYSAQLAALLGLPFAFAAHFAPDALEVALAAYRAGFRPTSDMRDPYVMVGINIVAADTDAEARYLFTSMMQSFLNLRRGTPGQLPPPVDSMDGLWSAPEKARLDHALRYAIVGGPDTVRTRLDAFVAATRADEIIVTTQVFDHAARLRSYEILAALREGLARPAVAEVTAA